MDIRGDGPRTSDDWMVTMHVGLPWKWTESEKRWRIHFVKHLEAQNPNYNNHQIMSQFCSCHDSWALQTCAKFDVVMEMVPMSFCLRSLERPLKVVLSKYKCCIQSYLNVLHCNKAFLNVWQLKLYTAYSSDKIIHTRGRLQQISNTSQTFQKNLQHKYIWIFNSNSHP